MGFGTWVQITDAFLASRGASHIGTSGGQWTVTLSANNIPRHRHVVDNHVHTIDHIHNYDHVHNRGSMEIEGAMTNNGTVWGTGDQSGITGAFTIGGVSTYQYPYVIGNQTSGAYVNWDFKASRSWSGVTSNPTNSQGSLTIWTSKQYSVDTSVEGVASGNSTATVYTDYQYAENPTAISITPNYVGVYTWYRSA